VAAAKQDLPDLLAGLEHYEKFKLGQHKETYKQIVEKLKALQADLAGSPTKESVTKAADEIGALADYNTFFNPSWGRLKAKIKPSPGAGHDYGTANAQGYFDYFNGVGNFTGPAGDRDKGYYAFDVGTWRIYAMNSSCATVAIATRGWLSVGTSKVNSAR